MERREIDYSLSNQVVKTCLILILGLIVLLFFIVFGKIGESNTMIAVLQEKVLWSENMILNWQEERNAIYNKLILENSNAQKE